MDNERRIAEKIPLLVDTLRATVLELDAYQRTARIDDNAPSRRRTLDATQLLDYIDGRRDSYP